MSVESVDEYVSTLNEDGKKYVNEFICFMAQKYPNLNHKICFSIPMWLVGRKMNEGYVGISGAKKHFSIHFSSDEFIIILGEKLPSCKTGRRCVNIKYGDDNAFQIVKDSIEQYLQGYIEK